VARRVKIKRKRPALRVRDFAVPGERMAYFAPLGVTVLAMVVLAFIGWKIFPDRPQIIGLFILWPVLAVLYAGRQAVGGVRSRIKREGLRTKVSTTNHPELLAGIARSSALLGIRAPEVYIMPGDEPTITSIGGKRSAIVVTEPVVEALTTEELEALLARELLHLRAKHTRFLNFIAFFRSAGLVAKLIGAPLLLMTSLMGPWEQMVKSTADRAALLVTGRSAPLNGALVKLAAGQDAMAQVDPAELNDYLSAGTDLTTDSEMMERHYRIGTFVSSQPGLSERIKDIAQFPRTEQGRAAFEKAQAVRRELQGA